MHAASFIRTRHIVLEQQLLQHPRKLASILVHELFHFVWPRLGTQTRASFEALIAAEMAASARGEIAESARVAKENLLPADQLLRTGRWREYVCEAFCDTAAYGYARLAPGRRNTLGNRWIRKRLDWLERAIDWNKKCF